MGGSGVGVEMIFFLHKCYIHLLLEAGVAYRTCSFTFPPSFPAAPGRPCSPGGPGEPGCPRSPLGPVSPVGPCQGQQRQIKDRAL